MTTESRIEAVIRILNSIKTDRYNADTDEYSPETDTEKVIVQLLMICKNQQQEINQLMAVENDRLDKIANL